MKQSTSSGSRSRASLVMLGIVLGSAISQPIHAQRKMENLGRGVVVTRTANNVALVSWRLLGTEPWNVGFNVYRSANGGTPVRLNASPLTGGTNFQDRSANFTQTNRYHVRRVVNGVEEAPSAGFTLAANTPVRPFFHVPIRPLTNYRVDQLWVGDLDGDGEFDFVFVRYPQSAEGNVLLDAYLRDGTFLWRYDAGPGSRSNASGLTLGHGDNITVWDIDSDGRANVIVRTADGSRFADGSVVRHSDNRRQFISVLDGMTGREIARADVPTDLIAYGPMNGHMGIAYLDGVNPSVIWSSKNRRSDGGFEMMVSAYSMQGNSLRLAWRYVRGSDSRRGSDGHQIRIADVDGDGIDEVIPWGFALNANGSKRWVLGGNANHGDRFHIGKLDPNRPGLQGYAIQQGNPSGLLWLYYDARDGRVLQSQSSSPPGGDLGRGMTGDLDPRHVGYEFWTFVDSIYNINGRGTSRAMPDGAFPNLRIWWDDNLLSENLDGARVRRWDFENSVLTSHIFTVHWTQGVVLYRNIPSFYGDILGDWREEIIYANPEQNALLINTTPYFTEHRIYTLPHNPKYRADMAVRGYAQSHMVDYFLGHGMSTPPRPNITIVGSTPANLSPNATRQEDVGSLNAVVRGDLLDFQLPSGEQVTVTLYNLKGIPVYQTKVSGTRTLSLREAGAKGTMILVVSDKFNRELMRRRVSIFQ